MRLLVTGATGYLGSELVRRAGAVGVSSRDFDIRDEAAVRAALVRHRPHVVIHAAYKQEDGSVNVDGSRAVARAATDAGARLIHMSTDVVFSGAKGSYVEEDAPDPVTDYGRAKAEAEREVAASHPQPLVVRTSLIYGGPGAPESKHERAARDAPHPFFTDELRCPVQVGDLATALLELAALDVHGTLHVAGRDAVSRHEFAELVARAPRPSASARELGIPRPLDCTLDSSRAYALLGTRIRGVREVLA